MSEQRKQRSIDDLIAEAMWRLHVPEAEKHGWVWGSDVSQFYADRYRRIARRVVTRESIRQALKELDE